MRRRSVEVRGWCLLCISMQLPVPRRVTANYELQACKLSRPEHHTTQTRVTRMWADAQRDGRPAEYRWRSLFNAANFGWRPLECCAVTLPRCETRWNLLGCHKLPNRSQPLVGWSAPYCEDMWRRYCCLTSLFPIVDTCLSCEDSAGLKLCDGAQIVIFCVIFASCISREPCAAHFRPAF